MHGDVGPFHLSHWGRLLALLLAGALVLQGGPVQLLVQQAQQTLVRHQCEHCHHQGFCPRNPDGPCTCDHSESAPSESGDGPVLTTCGDDVPDALGPVASPKWSSPRAIERPGPRVDRAEYLHVYQPLSPQRLGDEIFRPPRATTDVRLT